MGFGTEKGVRPNKRRQTETYATTTGRNSQLTKHEVELEPKAVRRIKEFNRSYQVDSVERGKYLGRYESSERNLNRNQTKPNRRPKCKYCPGNAWLFDFHSHEIIIRKPLEFLLNSARISRPVDAYATRRRGTSCHHCEIAMDPG